MYDLIIIFSLVSSIRIEFIFIINKQARTEGVQFSKYALILVNIIIYCNLQELF